MNQREAHRLALSWAASLLYAECDDIRFLVRSEEGYSPADAQKIANEIRSIANQLMDRADRLTENNRKAQPHA